MAYAVKAISSLHCAVQCEHCIIKQANNTTRWVANSLGLEIPIAPFLPWWHDWNASTAEPALLHCEFVLLLRRGVIRSFRRIFCLREGRRPIRKPDALPFTVVEFFIMRVVINVPHFSALPSSKLALCILLP